MISPVEITQSDFEVDYTFTEFALQSSCGDVYSIATLSKNTSVCFYPADGTEYCTIKAEGSSIIYKTIKDWIWKTPKRLSIPAPYDFPYG